MWRSYERVHVTSLENMSDFGEKHKDNEHSHDHATNLFDMIQNSSESVFSGKK